MRPRGRRGRAPVALCGGSCDRDAGSRLSRVPWDQLTDEQRELRDLVRSLARERIAPRAAEIDESHEFPWDVVELFREHGLFGLLFEEEWGGTGTGTLLALVAIEEISKVCATSGLILAVQELGSLGLKLAGTRGAAGALSAQARLRRVARRLRADRGRLGLRLGRDADDRAPRGRRVRPRRRQALHHQRRRREPLHRLRQDRSGRRPLRDLGLRRRVGRARLRGRAPRAEDGDHAARRPASSSSTAAACRPRTCSARRARASGSRCGSSTARGRASRRRALGIAQGATDYALEYAQDARDDGQADRRAPADRGQARRHGDGVRGGARAALPVRPDGRRGRRRRGADEGVGDGQALLLATWRWR